MEFLSSSYCCLFWNVKKASVTFNRLFSNKNPKYCNFYKIHCDIFFSKWKKKDDICSIGFWFQCLLLNIHFEPQILRQIYTILVCLIKFLLKDAVQLFLNQKYRNTNIIGPSSALQNKQSADVVQYWQLCV